MTWLVSAIQNATTIGLDPEPSRVEEVSKSFLKRLWWTILLRDRFVCLGRRCYPQFTSFNLNTRIDWLEEEDFSNEIRYSQVYEPDTKRCLLRILQTQCQLAVIVTDVISIAFSASAGFVPFPCKEDFHRSMNKIEAVKNALARWEKDSHLQLTPTDTKCPEFVKSFTKLTLLYY
jgi:hypothetical protein